MVDKSYIEDGRVQWGSLLGVIAGGWALAASEGTARVLLRFWTEIVAAQVGIADFYRALIGVPFAPFTKGGTITTAWMNAADLANTMGPIGVLLFAGELLLLAWLVGEGVERVR